MRNNVLFLLHFKFSDFKVLLTLFLGMLAATQIVFSTETATVNLQDEKVVTGMVTDATSGEALPGVSILIKGTSTGAITDIDGNYSITISGTNILVFSYVGYLEEEILVGDQAVINIALAPDIIGLEEVVVIGYGTQKKKLSTGANMHVGSDEIMQKKTMRLEQSLQGLAPGVYITSNGGQPGQDLRVNIRGVGTVGNSNPLYVVDGMVTDNLRFLNPSDIESVDILKDAASSSIYGARAANGVILITTKKGQTGDMRVSFDTYYGVQNVAKRLEMLDAQEYLMIQNEQRTNMGFNAFFDSLLIDTIGKGTDWQDYLFNEDAPIQSYVFSMSGGNNQSVYSSSVSYFSQEGIIGPDDKSIYNRISIRLNSEHKLYKDHVRFGENFVYSHEKQRGIGTDKIYGDNTVKSFLNTSPTFPAYDLSTADGFGVSWIPQLAAIDPNPLASLYYKYIGWTKRDKILGNVYGEVEFIKGLTLTTKLNIDLMYQHQNEYQPEYFITPTIQNSHSRAIMRMERNFTYNWENYINFNQSFGLHNLNVLLGNTVEEYNRFNLFGEKDNLVIEDFDNAILDGATDQESMNTGGGKIVRRLLSYYGRLNYDYAEKYLFSAVYRIDGSSKFGPDNKFGFFPSLSAGWVISSESFWTIDFIDFLKLRGSWGRNGNDKILDFMYEATIQSTERDYYFGADDVQFVGASPEKIHNDRLKWETSEQTNIGLDSRFKNFNFTFDIYQKITKDWLIIAPVSDLAGTNAPTINGGDVRNRGLEMMLAYNNKVGEFNYSVSGNIAFNQNEVLRIDNPEGIIHGEENQLFHGHQEVYRAQVGYPIGYFYGYQTDGIFQDTSEINAYTHDGRLIQPQAKPGDVRFIDTNGDGTIDGDDRIMIGNPYPDFTYGLSFDCAYKGFDFALLIQGVYGNEILYGLRNETSATSNYTVDILDRWTGPGTSNEIPRVTTGAEGNQNHKRVSDLSIEDGSYMKIRGLTIGYDFSKGPLKNVNFLSQFRIFVSAQNLFTLTKYPGYDPEVGYGDYDVTRYENYSIGIDNGYYPTPRTFLAGLNLKF